MLCIRHADLLLAMLLELSSVELHILVEQPQELRARLKTAKEALERDTLRHVNGPDYVVPEHLAGHEVRAAETGNMPRMRNKEKQSNSKKEVEISKGKEEEEIDFSAMLEEAKAKRFDVS